MRYNQFIIKKFVSRLIKKGHKIKSLNIFIYLLKELRRNTNKKPFKMLVKTIRIVKPIVAAKRIRRGSKFIYLPKTLTSENQYKQGINWLVKSAMKEKNNKFLVNLANEHLLTLKKKSKSIDEKNRRYALLLDSRPYLYLLKYN